MEAMRPALPPSDSNQLLPTILDNRARTNPHGIWAKFPVSPTTYGSGFRSATHLEVANAINKVAWLLDEHFGKGKDFETLAYLGPNDLRYTIVVVAGIKAGYKASYMSVPSIGSDNHRRFCHLLGIAQLATFLFSHGSNAKLWSLLLRSFHASRRYSKSTARENCRFPVFRNCLVRMIHLTILTKRSLKRQKMIRYLSYILPALQVTKPLLLFPSPADYWQVFQSPLYTRITSWRASQM
jgi:hypothetical protein